MRRFFLLLSASVLLVAATPEQEVTATLHGQVAAWNSGDLEKCVQYYSEESIFVGKQHSRGNAQVLKEYRRSYPTRERMGTLAYNDLEMRVLDANYVSVIGRFHLTRTAAGGGDSAGVFTLLLRKTASGWKIILDHTS